MTNHAMRAEPSSAAIRRFESGVRGDVLRPDVDDFDERRRVWNAAVDRHPALIIRPYDATDVQRTIELARTEDLSLAVRGGGHSPAGYGTVDDGIVIDLSSMKRIEIDTGQRIARAQPGLTWGEYNAAAHRHGLATPGGDVASVGVAGLTLSGGMGWLMRRFGMTIDNLLSVDIVTADGCLLRASEDEHPDLFWGVRGGGGNFGVATHLSYRLHPVDTILGGAIVHQATREGLRAYADAVAASPDDLTTITFVQKAPPLPFIPAEAHGTPVHVIIPCYVGDPASGERALTPLRSLAGRSPIADTVRPLPYPHLFGLTDMAAASRPHAIRNGFLRELTDETIDVILEHVEDATSPFSLVALRELGGAMSRVGCDETAFAHRDMAFYIAGDNSWDGDDADRHVAWTEHFWRAVAPQTEGAYTGFLEDEGDARVRSAYPPATYARLTEVKRRYDPCNLFRSNANVNPDTVLPRRRRGGSDVRDVREIADRLEIEALRGEFTDALMMHDYDRFASLFTTNGAWRMPYIDVEFATREEIRAGIERMQGLWEYFVQTVHAGTVELDGDAAVGRAYVSEFGRMHDGRSELNSSLYHDRYERTPDGWKFAERAYEVRYLDTTPLSGAAPNPSGAS